ncbi:187_t:CDS:2, partial [Entrophospora sp. SA101]
SISDEFLKKRWAKENQKFRNKGNVNKSDRYTAQDMYSELIKMAEDGEINQESIPRVESIQSWITHYAAACKAEASRNVINLVNVEF